MISFVNYFLPMDRYGRQKFGLVGLTVLALSLCIYKVHASTLTVYVDTTRKFEGDDYRYSVIQKLNSLQHQQWDKNRCEYVPVE